MSSYIIHRKFGTQGTNSKRQIVKRKYGHCIKKEDPQGMQPEFHFRVGLYILYMLGLLHSQAHTNVRESSLDCLVYLSACLSVYSNITMSRGCVRACVSDSADMMWGRKARVRQCIGSCGTK